MFAASFAYLLIMGHAMSMVFGQIPNFDFGHMPDAPNAGFGTGATFNFNDQDFRDVINEVKESVIDPNKLLGMEEDIFKQAGNNNFQSGHFNTQELKDFVNSVEISKNHHIEDARGDADKFKNLQLQELRAHVEKLNKAMDDARGIWDTEIGRMMWAKVKAAMDDAGLPLLMGPSGTCEGSTIPSKFSDYITKCIKCNGETGRWEMTTGSLWNECVKINQLSAPDSSSNSGNRFSAYSLKFVSVVISHLLILLVF